MKNKKITAYILIFPIIMLYIIFIGGGLLEMAKESLGHIPSLDMHRLDFSSYMSILNQDGFLSSLMYSIYLAFSATTLSTILGIIIAYVFVTSNNKILKFIVNKSLQMGLIIPYIYVIFLAVLFFSQSGFLSRLLYNIGIIDSIKTFPELIFHKNGLGIIWVYAFKGTPFIALFVLNVMSRISNKYADVALSLNANGYTILKKIYLPLCSKAVIWSSCIIFAYDLGSFEVSYMLGSISPISLSSRLYSLFISPDISMIPQARALNIIVLIVGLSVVGLYSLLLKRILRGKFT